MRPCWLAFFSAFVAPAILHAQPSSEAPATYSPRIHRLRFDLPALDARENVETGCRSASTPASST
ncbi:MAG: hypothetical protein ABI895_33005 [Deltaproteobacteria bacterium]